MQCKSCVMCVTLLLALVLAPAIAWSKSPLEIVYSGNLDGELEPCGCSEQGDLGGIKRRASVIERMRKAQPDVFLISGGGLLSAYTANEKLTGEFILKGIEKLNYDAIAVQWADIAFGLDFVKPYEIPWVASNWVGDDFAKEMRVTKGAKQLAVFSFMDPRKAADVMVGAGESAVSSELDTIMVGLAKAKQEGVTTLLTTTLRLRDVKRNFDLTNVDILLIRAAYEEYGEPQQLDHTLILEPGSRGMRLGHLKLTLDDSGRISSFNHEVIPMPSQIPDAASMAQWYDDYNARVKEAYLKSVATKKAIDSGERPYVGATACQSCHEDAYAAWAATRHAQAYDALEEVNKAFDPACIGCHTVGFNKEGGFIDSLLTEHLKNVQCESCHGPARDHVASAGLKPVVNADWEKSQMCEQCHVQKHSPAFKLDDYWPKIAH